MTAESRILDFPITGMTCASCAAQVERALRAVAGVSDAIVNLATGSASVRITNGLLMTDELVGAVQEAGYDVPVENFVLPVGGMTCVSCIAHVEGSLIDVPGVLSAGVNLASGLAMIVYVPGAASPADFKQAVFEAGYQVPETGTGNTR